MLNRNKELEQEVENRYREGDSPPIIAYDLGVNKKRVDSIIKKVELRQVISVCIDKGMTNTEISTFLKIPYKKVSAVRVLLNKNTKFTVKQLRKLLADYRKILKENPKCSNIEAAKLLNVSPSKITYIRRKKNIAPKRTVKYKDTVKAKIKKLLDETPNMSNADIAEKLNKPKSNIQKYLKEMGVEKDKFQVYNVLFVSIAQQVKDLIAERGYAISDKELAEKIGICKTTLYRWLQRLGIPNGKKRKQHNYNQFFRKMWEDGWSDTEIAEAMGCCHQLVQSWRKKNNLVHNVIHRGIYKGNLYRSHTPTTLLDMIGSPMGVSKLDRIFAFAALGANKKWLKKRFQDATWAEIEMVCGKVLEWQVPKNLRAIVRLRQLRDKPKDE